MSGRFYFVRSTKPKRLPSSRYAAESVSTRTTGAACRHAISECHNDPRTDGPESSLSVPPEVTVSKLTTVSKTASPSKPPKFPVKECVTEDSAVLQSNTGNDSVPELLAHLQVFSERAVLVGCSRSWFPLFLVSLLLFSFASAQDSCSNGAGCFPTILELFTNSSVYQHRTVEVSSNCADNSSNYRSVARNDTTEYTCVTSQSRPEFIVDRVGHQPNLTSYWQSINTVSQSGSNPLQQTIVLNFTDEFLVHDLYISFIAPQAPTSSQVSDARPRAVLIEKWNKSSRSWVNLRAFAESCRTAFSSLPLLLPIHESTSNPLTSYCFQGYYAGDNNTQTYYNDPNSNIQTVDYYPGIYDRTDQFKNNRLVKEQYLTSALRITLVQPASNISLQSYYAVADIMVDGQCECYGHASECSGKNGAECICQHNTMGPKCLQCLPLYNNRTWKMGTFNSSNECEACFCNDHATTCHYDPQKGYGVCDNCTNGTRGDHCSECDTGFFINPLYNSSVPPNVLCKGFIGEEEISYPCNIYCLDCGCSSAGSLESTCTEPNGQCSCKQHVTGTKCDQCLDNYWGLNPENPLGCTACNCSILGTYNSNPCNKTTGACICKTNTNGAYCDQCKPETFGISAEKEDGCTLCNCDPGASLDNICNATISSNSSDGQCKCRKNIEGRDCRQPVSGYFVPKMDYFLVEAEYTHGRSDMIIERPGHGQSGITFSGRGFYSLLPSNRLIVNITAFLAGDFDLIIRYEKTGASTVVLQVNVSMVTGTQYVCKDLQYTADHVWSFESGFNHTALPGAIELGSVCLSSNLQYFITISNVGSEALLIDSVFLRPDIRHLVAFSSSTVVVQQEMLRCLKEVQTTLPWDRKNCTAVEYSLMAELLDGALICSCSRASTSSLCNSTTGDCPCPSGVLPPDCSSCKVEYYDDDGSLMNGCTPCLCHPGGTASPICNNTGFCRCRENVTGVKCDACLLEHYGLGSNNGCSPCLCNMDFAVNNQCNESGSCVCKPGIGRQLCDTCLDGYFNLTSDGCTPCDCHPSGSILAACNKLDGTCSCKSRVTGQKCHECKPGYFGLGLWHPDGCISCFCSNHTKNCTAAEGWHSAYITSNWPLDNSSALNDYWTGRDELGNAIDVDNPIVFGMMGYVRLVMRLTNTQDNVQRSVMFFVAPPSYLGDKRSSYAQELKVSLRISTTSDINLNYTGGDIILKGNYSKMQLVYTFPFPPNTTLTEYSVPLLESAWHVETNSGPVPSFTEFMQTLSALSDLWIRGKFSNATDAKVDLFMVVLSYAVHDDRLANTSLVNSIEECSCPLQYQGEFCENCAAGYHRENTQVDPLDVCVSCDCNNHAREPCDDVTGVCVCTHNTTGNHCEQCLSGFYGNGLVGTPVDCHPCMCPGSIPDLAKNAFATYCKLDSNGQPQCFNCSEGHEGQQCEFCMQGFYGVPTNASNAGGRCLPCTCNGRAVTCDSVTGMCINCTNNTRGKECDICASGYYGDAMANSCIRCQCDSLGSTGECNPSTGQCICHPNVVGFTCHECAANTYNLTSGSGCVPCDCYPQGSAGPACNMTTGQCQCLQFVVGQHCNNCADNFWQLNNVTGCNECGCDLNGTLEIDGHPLGTCDILSGQCTCKMDGIIGRTCNACSPVSKLTFKYATLFNIGEYPNCVMCGECFDSWALKIDNLGRELDVLHGRITNVWSHYGNMTVVEVNMYLSTIENSLIGVGSSLVRVQNITSALSHLNLQLLLVQNQTSGISKEIQQSSEQRDALQSKIALLANFTGEVMIDNTTIPGMAAKQILTNITKSTEAAESTLRSANTSWYQVQELSAQIAVVVAGIAQIEYRGVAAMELLGLAKRTFDIAGTIYNSTFNTSFRSNNAELNHTQSVIQGASLQLSELRDTVARVESEFNVANATLGSIIISFTNSLSNMRNVALLLYGLKDDVMLATNTISAAFVAVEQYKARAVTAATAISSAFQDILEGLLILKQLQTSMASTRATANFISSMTLRPLEEMKGLASTIEQTVVPVEVVSQTNIKAKSALQMADLALNETERALVMSRQALEEVTTIQENIQEALSLLTTARQTHNATSTLNTTTFAALHEAQNRAAEMESIISTTNAAIIGVQGQINQVITCFQTRSAEAVAALSQADMAQIQSQVALQAQTSLAQVMSTLASETPTTVDAPLSDIQTASSMLSTLQSNLTTLLSATEVSDLLETYRSQQESLQTLEQEVIALETELNSLIESLTLISASPTCNTNY